MTATKAAVQLRKEELRRDASSDKQMSLSDSDSEPGPYSTSGKTDGKQNHYGGGIITGSANKFNYYERGTQTSWSLCKVSVPQNAYIPHKIQVLVTKSNVV